MTSTKYELTDITHPAFPRLHRIRALRDIRPTGVKAGDLGGWVEGEHNLSHDGAAWVYGEARVSERARVSDNARVSGSAQVSGNAWVIDNAWVSNEARVSGNAHVGDSAHVYGEAQVCDDAWVCGSAVVTDIADVSGQAAVDGHAFLLGDAQVREEGDIFHASIMASGRFPATLHRTRGGHALMVGCWRGTVPEFRTMIESDEWVGATPDQIKLRRPELLAFTAMCEARIATWEKS